MHLGIQGPVLPFGHAYDPVGDRGDGLLGRPGLALADEAFHPTVLTLWRNKLRASDDPDRFFNAVRAVIAETGVIAGKQ